MAKRLTKKQLEEIKQLFILGININDLSQKFVCTKLTIVRNLKKQLGEDKYQELLVNQISNKKLYEKRKKEINFLAKNISERNDHFANDLDKQNKKNKREEENSNLSEFIEIAPLNFDLENSSQKDLSSIPISEVSLPKIVFMIVDKKIELETKFLKDYPRWHFLSKEELDRKTIEIYYELRLAKEYCGKEQKVIKVPDTNVFRKVAPILISRGISRIVTSDQLISL